MLGGGVNLLVRDEPVAGAVIRLSAPAFTDVKVDGTRVHREDSGYSIYLDDPAGNRIELATKQD